LFLQQYGEEAVTINVFFFGGVGGGASGGEVALLIRVLYSITPFCGLGEGRMEMKGRERS
jgi:hypothetical protein